MDQENRNVRLGCEVEAVIDRLVLIYSVSVLLLLWACWMTA